MKINVLITTDLKFQVESYEDSDGESVYHRFGGEYGDLPRAIEAWRLATHTEPDKCWMNTTTPQVNVQQGKL